MVAERYIAGKLSLEAREEFEEHYFGCDRCFGEVEALRAVKEVLRAPKAAAPTPSRRWMWALPIAAALLFGFVLWPRSAPPEARVTRPATRDYSALAHFEPPPWNQVRLRGTPNPDEQTLEAARRTYTVHDYASCARSLDGGRLTAAHYYRGICLLLAGNSSEGILALRQTVAEGDTPYLEESRFYLAKALLAGNDAAAAGEQLRQVVALHGDLERQATLLLAQLK